MRNDKKPSDNYMFMNAIYDLIQAWQHVVDLAERHEGSQDDESCRGLCAIQRMLNRIGLKLR